MRMSLGLATVVAALTVSLGAQELKPDWDYKQAIDTSLVEK